MNPRATIIILYTYFSRHTRFKVICTIICLCLGVHVFNYCISCFITHFEVRNKIEIKDFMKAKKKHLKFQSRQKSDAKERFIFNY